MRGDADPAETAFDLIVENGGFPSDTAWIRTLHIRTPSGQVSPKRIIEYIIWSRMTT